MSAAQLYSIILRTAMRRSAQSLQIVFQLDGKGANAVMLTRPNDVGGTTLVLEAGDELDAVPNSHCDTVTDSVRKAFQNPASYFSEIAEQTKIENLRRYLSKFVADGKWWLLLAETNLMQRDTFAAIQWWHADLYPCMFGPFVADCSDDRFTPLYDSVSMVHWDEIGFAGGIVPFGKHVTVAGYGTPSINPAFPPESTSVFGNSANGDMMVCNADGDAGYLSHETGDSYVIGSFAAMLEWVFGELLQKRTPKFDYSRCR